MRVETSGGASIAKPTARRSKPSTGLQPGAGTSVRIRGPSPPSWSGGTGPSTLFIIPLMVQAGAVRKLTFLGSDLGDYNAPLLALSFPGQVTPAAFPGAMGRVLAACCKAFPGTGMTLSLLPRCPKRSARRPIRS